MAVNRDYELVMVLSPILDSEQVASVVEGIHNIITTGGGELLAHEPWGIKRLAYPIDDFTEGNYSLTQFKGDASHTKQIEESLRLSESVIRHLLVKRES